MITTTDPRTGTSAAIDIEESTIDDVTFATTQAAEAAGAFASAGRELRARLLEQIAETVEAARAELVETGMAETGLAEARMNTEITRCVFQFSLFAEAIREGSYLEPTIDHAASTVLGPQPDVRRMLVPIGAVAVFGASNFPFAFSVLGGDVASALAAGCPVVLKAHGSHPLVSQLSFNLLRQALEAVGMAPETVGIVHGVEPGRWLVRDPRIQAVGFTGSLGAALALQAEIAQRPMPIPFFGELSSVNPLIVTGAAAQARGAEIAQGLFVSYTGSMGQLCTKPGIAFIPATTAGDELVDALAEQTRAARSGVLLNSRIRSSFEDIEQRLQNAGGQPLAEGLKDDGEGSTLAPVLLKTTASELSAELAEECFGPMLVIARYESLDEVTDAMSRIPSSLTATVHAEDTEHDVVDAMFTTLAPYVGRLVYNGYPTGVRVSWAQHHGGPWPATNTQHTSVGVSAIRRWLRPLAWQDAPESVLPSELRDGYDEIPRRVDGKLELPSSA